MQKAKIPSVAVAVSQHGQVLWEEAFGYADRGRRIRATVHTPYGLASVTKILTASSIMILSDEGRIDIDRPANDYLGRARITSPKWDANGATVRRVATHTAGLTTYDSVCYDDEPSCDRSADDMIAHYAVVFWRPGDHFDYSNLGYGILDQVVAHVSGESYPAFLRDHIFRPLGMCDCVMDETPGVAQHYGPDRRPVRMHWEVALGASSAACSVDSLIRFGMFALGDRTANNVSVLRRTTMARMRSETVDAGNGQRYGIGWWVDENQHGVRNVFDQGGTFDTTALLDTIPSQDIAVAVLLDTGNPIASDIADRVLAAMIPAYAADLGKHSKSPADKAAAAPLNVGSFAATWVGTIKTYAGDVPVKFVVASNGSTRASVGGATLAPARKARRNGKGIILGAFGNVGTPDARRRQPYRLGFELYPDDHGLYGAVRTWQQPGARDGGLFSYWVRLKRQ